MVEQQGIKDKRGDIKSNRREKIIQIDRLVLVSCLEKQRVKNNQDLPEEEPEEESWDVLPYRDHGLL